MTNKMGKALLAIIQKIKNETGGNPGKKQLHKLVYLMQAKGISLGYEYGIHFYGPYSEELNNDLLRLCINGDVSFQIKGQTHEIEPVDTDESVSVSPENEQVIDSVIRQYKDTSPYDLELITTAHFVAVNLGSSENEILKGVKRIKGDKYPEAKILQTVGHLKAEYGI
ncbi:MAG: DUF4065 domain-containing protein [Oscillospiraceae bacterium]|jgi:uncharacterized protein YwgA|nr:DUF4065 domain-containing protein [Oscillospiraceae bacterium]